MSARKSLDTVIDTAAKAVADIPMGAVIAAGGFGICGIPMVRIDALVERGITDLEIISNNCGTTGMNISALPRGSKMTTHQPVWLIGGFQSDFARNFTKESLEISDLVKETTSGTLTHAGRASIESHSTT